VLRRRKAAGLTQRQLAELAGVGERLVVELESGKPTLRMDAVNKVLGVFGKQLGIVEGTLGVSGDGGTATEIGSGSE
jgi:y4mF family transcriptional regulator